MSILLVGIFQPSSILIPSRSINQAIMKNSLVILALILGFSVVAQEKTIKVTSEINEVTVYLSGASIHRTAKVSIPIGRSIIEFDKLSGSLNPQSIQASLTGEARILAISYRQDFLSPPEPSKEFKIVGDSIKILTFQKEDIATENAVLEQEKKVLLDNNKRLGQKEGVTTGELELAADFYQKRLLKIYKLIKANDRKKAEIEKILIRLRGQQGIIGRKLNQSTYTAEVLVESKKVYSAIVNLDYGVNSAGWSPRYSIRSNGPGSPIQLEYLAMVGNSTGRDWTNVSLTLSTGDPSKSMVKPSMDTWNLNYNSQVAYREGRLQNMRSDDNVGFASEVMADFAFKEVEMDRSEVEVSELSVDFKVKDKYTIPATGRAKLVQVNEFELANTQYRYFAVPKVDKDAFLLAHITEWEKLNLVDGPANVYFNGQYVGETNIDTRYSADTLEVSLGRDPKVIVTRVKKEDKNAKKIIGLNRKETLTYEIAIRNTHAEAIEIEVWSQVPVSQESDIEVAIIDISGATQDEQNGKLEWIINVEPAQTVKRLVSFSVKYPKKKNLQLRKSRKVSSAKYY